MASPPRTHFSMIRNFHLADLFTIANGFCGVGALFEAMRYLTTQDRRHLYVAALLIPLAFVFDVLDGRIARWRHAASPMGREMDSLADVISFGVTPAMIGYACGMQGLYDRVVLAYFVACGVSRLARYNVTAEALSEGTGKVKYFEGTPIPTSFLVACILTAAASTGAVGDNLWFGKILLAGYALHPFSLIFALSGTLMISRIHIPKL
jgi:CDP-diacylglycerol---serine O-phosphatidyltransferase